VSAPTITYDRTARVYEVAGAGGKVLATFRTYSEAAAFRDAQVVA
jgi:hypothetical protein